MRRTAILIAGGGPAGAAAAITLAGAGEKPLLIERDRETGDAFCGGFLSWRTLDQLRKLGFDPPGTPIRQVRLFAGHHRAESRLPGPALGLSRRTLDGALLSLAVRAGVAVERGVSIRETHPDGHVRLDDGGQIKPDALLLATGKHDLRGLARPREAIGDDPALGLRVHLDPSPALSLLIGASIELHLFDRGYAGLLLQEDGRANLCMAVRKSRLAESGGRPAALLEALGRESPALGERLAWLSNEPPDAIAALPYGWTSRETSPGIFRLGDQAGVMPSLAGEGIGIALSSGVLAARAILAGDQAIDYQRRLHRRLRRPIATATLVSALAQRPRTAPLMAIAMNAVPGLATLLARATRIDA